ncbi:hypothetical protein [Streptomyces sp. L2]|uniref:hypothetical protein n=1 Tax=Streptomyces sp. L2 TaxID=2162665 RepID=UPI0010127CE1|nr:hypothetical protein [Streptomyces sp. L2]
MTRDPATRQALARFDELPPPKALLLEALSVHQWFTVGLVAHTAADLAVAVTPEGVFSTPFVVKDRVPFPAGPSGERQYGIRSVLRVALHERMRTERPELHRQAHRIAATYYNQPLEPLRTDRLTWYVNEIRHLSACRPRLAAERLTAFAHASLVAGYAEAAGRAAAEVAAGSPAADDQALAGIVEAIAQILNAPAHVEHGTVVLLNDLLTRYTPAGPAANRLVLLARDLVVHYTERPDPVTPLTALVAPDATAVVDARGVPVLGGELRLLEDLAHPARTIRTRVHRVELPSSKVAEHRVTTTLATEGRRAGRGVVLVDVLPRDNWHQLNSLKLSERGTRNVDVLRAPDAARTVAQGLGRLLDADSPASGASGRAELSQRLSSLGRFGGEDELHDLLDRTRRSDDVEELLRNRAAELMRYTPVVALLDVYPGVPAEVSYEQQEECTVRRDGLGRAVVSVPLVLPLELHNQLEFVAPHGLEPVFPPVAPGVHFTPVRGARPGTAVQQFEVEAEDREEDGTARIHVDLGYHLPDREFRGARRTAALCMAASLLPPLLLLIFSTSLATFYGSVIATIVAFVETPKDGFHQEAIEPLQVYAGRRLLRLRQSNTLVAVTSAVAAPTIAVSVFVSLAAFLWCLGTSLFVGRAWRRSTRPLEGPSSSARRTLHAAD